MSSITLAFNSKINISLKNGDVLYYSNSTGEELTKMGNVTGVTEDSIVCEISDSVERPGVGDFVLFSKDNKIHSSSLKGYYAETVFKNNSTMAAELFSVNADISESSK